MADNSWAMMWLLLIQQQEAKLKEMGVEFEPVSSSVYFQTEEKRCMGLGHVKLLRTRMARGQRTGACAGSGGGGNATGATISLSTPPTSRARRQAQDGRDHGESRFSDDGSKRGGRFRSP